PNGVGGAESIQAFGMIQADVEHGCPQVMQDKPAVADEAIGSAGRIWVRSKNQRKGRPERPAPFQRSEPRGKRPRGDVFTRFEGRGDSWPKRRPSGPRRAPR